MIRNRGQKKTFRLFPLLVKEGKVLTGGSLLAVLLGLTAFVAGFVSVLLGLSPGATLEDVTRAIFYFFYILFLFVGLLLASHQFVNERRQGTMELLQTLPLNAGDLVFGKFFVALPVLGILTFFLSYLYLVFIGETPFYLFFTGATGLLLVSLYGYSVGLFASSLSDHYAVSLFVGGGILVGIDLGGYMAGLLGSPFREIFSHLHALNQFTAFTRGVFSLRSILFFLSLIGIFLFFTIKNLEFRKMRG